MRWFRFYHEARTDRKLEALTDAQYRVWINLLCYAAEQEQRGAIEIESEYLLAIECARGDEELLTDTLSVLVKLGIVERDADEVIFVNWGKRQYDSDNSTERVRAFRERQKEQSEQDGNVTETLQEQQANVSPSVNTDTDTDTDTEAEKSIAPKPARVREPDPLFEAIAEAWKGEPYRVGLLNTAQSSLVGKATADIRGIGGLPDQVPREWELCRQRFDNPTPAALAKHWGTNGTGPKREQRKPDPISEAAALIWGDGEPDRPHRSIGSGNE